MELAVGASQATLKSVLSKLGDFLANEYTVIRSLRGDIQYINDEFASMQAFLANLSGSSRHRDAQTTDWMKQVRDIAYDMEDCVDEFTHRLPPDSRGDCHEIYIILCDVGTWWPRRGIAANVADIKRRVQQVAERRQRYGVRDPEGVVRAGAGTRFDVAKNQVTTPQLVLIKEPVGMDRDKEPLEEWLEKNLKMEDKRRVLSIVGYGGVGKTTIAMAVYQQFADKFDYRAVVTVSQSSDLDTVLGTILKQVKPQAYSRKQGSNLEQRGMLVRAMTVVSRDFKRHSSHKAAVREGASVRHQHKRGSSSDETHVFLRGVKSERDSKEESSGKDDTSEANNCVAFIGDSWRRAIRCARGSEQHGTNETLNPTQQELNNHLKENSYLILIDDVWSATMWEQIANYLPVSSKHCTVIVTTRFDDVASRCYQDIEVDFKHTIDVLKDVEAEKLFWDAVSESQSSQITPRVPPRVWTMCGGLPLAIVTVAGLVACNLDNDWTEVCRSLFPDPTKAPAQEVVTRMILDYCYNDLPGDLKTCILYLSMFPKGRNISRKRLTRRWIAEGFVSEKQGLGVQDVAEAYFNHLMRRKFIRPVEHSSNGKVKSCQVHDMVLEYIVAKSREENFTTVIGGHWVMPTSSNKVRRLSLHSSDSIHAKAVDRMNLSRLRSLTVSGSFKHLPSQSFKIGLVQVLDLEGCIGFEDRHVSELSDMILLKYLSLRRTDIADIPSNIDKLKYLETLDVRETHVKKLPRAICQLERVNNILGGNKIKREALRLPEIKKGTMRSLHILSGIEIDEKSSIVENLQMFTVLRKLVIYKLRIRKNNNLSRSLLSAIQYIGGHCLQSLTIIDDCSDFLTLLDSLSAPPRFLHALELCGMLLHLPKWITELKCLKKLTLSVTALRTDTFQMLRELPCLFSLTFLFKSANQCPDMITTIEKNKSLSNGKISIPTGGFKCLKLLRFSVPLLPSLSISNYAMPKLERLELKFKAFEGLTGMDKLQNLKEVHLTVNENASKATQLIVDDLIRRTNDYVRKPIIIRDQYIE